MKNINIFTILISAICLLASCQKENPVVEKSIGPFTVACQESFDSYANNKAIIDSLIIGLDAENIESQMGSFGIFYERYDSQQFHSIVGAVIDSVENSSVGVHASRKDFTVREIHLTNCMTFEAPLKNLGDELRSSVQHKFDEYAQLHNFTKVPNGEIGIMEFYNGDKVLFAAEIIPE